MKLKVFFIIIFFLIFNQESKTQIVFNTNEAFIKELVKNELSVSIKNKISLFEHFYFALQDTLNIFPTENYYYFEFIFNKVEYQGNLGLLRNLIDKGEVNFGYYPKSNMQMEGVDYLSLGINEEY